MEPERTVHARSVHRIGSHFDTWVRGWYDTNGNGQRDAGELSHERFGGGENRAPDIALVPLQP